MAKHKPSVIWGLRRNVSEYIRTLPDGVEIVVLDRSPSIRAFRVADGYILNMDRRTARLLAKRLMQCLDDTA